MSAFDYSRSRATADRLIARFGQAGTLKRPTKTGSGHNQTEGVPVEEAATFVVLDYATAQIDGTRILATDKMVYLKAGTMLPQPGDQLLEASGAPFKVVGVRPFSPAGTVVYHELRVRR